MSFRKSTLRSLVNSKNDTHLSIYVGQSLGAPSVDDQIESALESCQRQLRSLDNSEKSVKLLQPVIQVLSNPNMRNNLPLHWGLFRNSQGLRILSLPLPVQPIAVVADSFHIKPLLQWMQSSVDFYLMQVKSERVDLFHSFGSSVRLVDSFAWTSAHQLKGIDSWAALEIAAWWKSIPKDHEARCFISGSAKSFEALRRRVRIPQADCINSEDREFPLILSEIRERLVQETRIRLQASLIEFQQASYGVRPRKNLFQIVRAAVEGRVRKLVVASDVHIFGRVDKSSGGVALHPMPLDAQDDDLLDDIAQMVLAAGGEVVVATKEQIPEGRPILALVEDQLDIEARPA